MILTTLWTILPSTWNETIAGRLPNSTLMVKVLKYARFLVFLCCFSLLLITPHAQDDHDREWYREVLRAGRGSIRWADWNPNGQQIVVLTQNNEAWLYTVPDFGVLLHLKNADWAWFSADERWLIARRPDVSFALYDAVNLFDTPVLDNLELPLFSSDNRYVLIRPIGGEPSIRLSDDLATVIALPHELRQPDIGLAWRPDANVLTGFTPENAVITWDIDSDSAPQTISLQGAFALTEPKWSPDGARLIAHDADQKIVIWDATTGARLLEIPDSAAFDFADHGLPYLHWSPDGQHFVRVFYGDPQIHGTYGVGLYSAKDGQVKLAHHQPDIIPPRFSPDGSYFSFGYGIYRTANAESVITHYSYDAHWHPDGRYVVIPLFSGGVEIMDMQTKTFAFFIDFRPNTTGGNARWSSDGSRLLSWEYGGALVLWDTKSWKQIARLNDHTNPTRKLAFSPDSRLLAGSDIYGTMYIWDVTTFELRHALQRHSSNLAVMEWQPDNNLLAATTGKIFGASGDVAPDDANLVYIWGGDTGELVTTLEHTALITSTAWSPNGRYFASVSGIDLKVWDASTRQLVIDQAVTSLSYAVVTWSRDSSIVLINDGAMSHGGRHYRMWDALSGKPLSRSVYGFYGDYTWTPDSQRMLGIGMRCQLSYPSRDCSLNIRTLFDRDALVLDRNIELSDELTGFTAGKFATFPTLYASPSGDALITLEDENAHAQLWHFDHMEAALAYEIESVTSVQWSPDGQYVALSLKDETVSVIESQSGEVILTVENRASPFWRMDDTGLRFFVRQIDPDPYDRDFPLQEEWSLTTKTRIDVGSSLNQLWSNDGRLWAEAYTGMLRLWSE